MDSSRYACTRICGICSDICINPQRYRYSSHVNLRAKLLLLARVRTYASQTAFNVHECALHAIKILSTCDCYQPTFWRKLQINRLWCMIKNVRIEQMCSIEKKTIWNLRLYKIIKNMTYGRSRRFYYNLVYLI